MPEQASYWIMTSSYDVGPFKTYEEAAAYALTAKEIIADGRENPGCTTDIWEDRGCDAPVTISMHYPAPTDPEASS